MLAVKFTSGTGLTLDFSLVGGGNWQLCCEEPALNFRKIKYLVLTAGLTAGVGGFYYCQTLWTQGRTVNMNMVKVLAVLACSWWESNLCILIYTLLVYLYAWTCCLIIGGELCIDFFFLVLLRNVKGCYSWFLPQNHAVSKLSCWWSLVHCKAWSVAT